MTAELKPAGSLIERGNQHATHESPKIPRPPSLHLCRTGGHSPSTPLHNAIDYDNAVEMMGNLIGYDLNADQEDYLEALSEVAGDYEDVHHAKDLSHVTALEALRYLVEQNGMTGRFETERISPATCPPEQDHNYTLRLITGTNRKNIHLQNIEMPPVTGSHDGGDDRMLRHLLDPGCPDPDQQTAGSLAGAASTLIGSCANKSCATGQWVNLPDYHQIAAASHHATAANT